MPGWGIHVRRPEQAGGKVDAVHRLARLCGGALSDPVMERLKRILAPNRCSRIYAGDEFCPRRLPGANRMQALREAAAAGGKGFTLLTPPMTDGEMARLAPALSVMQPGDEVVVNDWGVLRWMASGFPHLSRSLGRLLNKGFKDSRLPDSPQPDERLPETTFDGKRFQAFAGARGVDRLEMDLLPHADGAPFLTGSPPRSIYFPFGYITTGRICWISGMAGNGPNPWVPGAPCRRPCGRTALGMTHAATPLHHIQNGNTLFYQYTERHLASLAEAAEQHHVRPVYQGEAL